MATNTFVACISDLFNVLASDSVGTSRVSGVTKVYAYEPANHQSLKPVVVTISPAGMTPYDWTIALRVYQTTDVDPAAAQSNIISMTTAIDSLLFSTVYGPSNWTFDLNNDLGVIVATAILEVGRTE